MDFLLKIVEGPMKGAEVALVAGTRVKVGSADACDIVFADASLPEVAFELDIADEVITLLRPDGTQEEIVPFEIHDFGTTAVAFGPAGETWQELHRAAPKPAAAEAAAEIESAAEGKKEEVEAAAEVPPAEEEKAPEKEAPAEKKSGHRGCGCLIVLIVLLLLVAAAVAAWFFHPPSRERMEDCWERTDPYREQVLEWWKKLGREERSAPAAVVEAKPSVTLAEIARTHNLRLTEEGGLPLIKGNLLRRTERMAIRALARSVNAECRFDLTDDETLLRNAADLLFAYTDGAIKADSASNRVVAISGYAPSPEALERAIRALNADVPGIDRLDTARVTVGGTAPPRLARTEFVRQGDETIEEIEEREMEQRKQRQRQRRPRATAASSRPDYPIAGVLTKPYPCVVMRNGHRVMEGAQIGTAKLVKIEADELTLSEGDRLFKWRP